MEEKNELNDIILNKGNSAGGNKKVILAVATLGVILIIVVMLMNTLTSNDRGNLPKPVPLPKPQSITSQITEEAVNEPLFEEVEVVEEEAPDTASLEAIAQKLKEESLQEKVEPKKVEPKVIEKKVEPKKVVAKPVEPKKTVAPSKGKNYYVQVGSFSKYKPNKKFLNSITDRGYEYRFFKVNSLTKVLVGPFSGEKEARGALRHIRTNIEAGAFLTKQ